MKTYERYIMREKCNPQHKVFCFLEVKCRNAMKTVGFYYVAVRNELLWEDMRVSHFTGEKKLRKQSAKMIMTVPK
jgi:hypothetical protein